jgi:putative addiction module component (TIGR02574 family)
MNERVKHILNEASSLSDDERVALASALMDSLRPVNGAIAADWRQEIASRFEAYSQGAVSGRSGAP